MTLKMRAQDHEPPDQGVYRAKLVDLMMLTMFGAQERTGAEYRALLEAAGFGEAAVHQTDGPWSIVEAVRP